MITDTVRDFLDARRREIAETREHKQFEDLIDRADTSLMALVESETAANERALTSALDAIKAHVLARLVENGGDASALPLLLILADGRTVREVCAGEIAAVADVRRSAEEVRTAERYVIGDRERLEEAKRLYIEPLESTLAADVAEIDASKKRAAEAETRLDALKRKHRIG